MNRFMKLATATLFAASAALASPHFGIQAGLGLNGFNGDDAKDVNAGLGLAVGGTMVMPLGSGLAFNPQLLFAYRTSSMEGDLMGASFEATNTDMALNMPLLVRYSIMPELFVQAGPELGLLLSSESESDYAGSTTTTDIKSNRKTLEYGLAVGLGYQITPEIAVDLKYNYGLNDYSKEGNGDVSPYQLLLGASYLF